MTKETDKPAIPAAEAGIWRKLAQSRLPMDASEPTPTKSLIYQGDERSTMLTSWSDSVYLEVSDDGLVGFSVTRAGEHGTHVLVASAPGHDVEQLLEGLRAFCDEHEHELDDLVAGVGSVNPCIGIALQRLLALEDVEAHYGELLNELVRAHASRARHETATGSTNARLRSERIEAFTRAFLEEFKRLPEGEVEVDGMPVEFRSAD